MSVPADHSTTAQAIGKLGVAKIMVRAAWNYRHTIAYWIRRRDFKSLYNFIYTKVFVPTGEGAGELAYYFIGSYLQKHPLKAPYPKYIEAEMTSRCNKRCIICEHTHWNEPSRDLTFDAFKGLTDQFDLRWMNLTGEGDAFLNPDYLRMIEHLKNRSTSVYLVDSFDLLDISKSSKLVDWGVDGIYISMDGATKETYESIKIGCSFDKVTKNIQDMLNYKKKVNSPVPEICFRFVVTRKNFFEMPAYVKLINSFDNLGDGSKIHFVGLLDFPEVHDLYIPEIPSDFIARTLNTPSKVPAVLAHTAETTNPDVGRCLNWMEPYFALVPEPMALPCCAVMMSNSRSKLLEYSFGNYQAESFEDLWNHPYYQWFRESVTDNAKPLPALCKGCRAYDTRKREALIGVDYRKREDFE